MVGHLLPYQKCGVIKMKYTKYNEYGNTVERIENPEYGMLVTLKKKHFEKLEEIKNSNRCFGDKVREIIKQKITDNTVYARKLLEMV